MRGFKEFFYINESVYCFSELNSCLYGSDYLLEDTSHPLWKDFERERQNAPWRLTPKGNRAETRNFFSSNPKTKKSDLLNLGDMGTTSGINQKVLNNTIGDAQGYASYIIHLTPAAQSGFVTCPFASKGCRATCLQTSGNIGALADKTGARLKKTWWIAKEMPFVMDNLANYLPRLIKKTENQGNKLVIRLNGTSDLRWEDMRDSEGKTLMERFPNIIFYDYTKDPGRIGNVPSNYHLTFSRSEKNEQQAVEMLQKGTNVAIPFGPGKVWNKEELKFPDGRPLLPAVWNGFKVINGDKHDLRFLEQRPKGKAGLVIGLTAKGAAAFESYDTEKRMFLGKSGFVVQPNDPSITAYPANQEYIQVATQVIQNRNASKKNKAGGFAKAKNKYMDEQKTIAGLLSGDLPPEEMERLAAKPEYKRLIGSFQDIENYCKKFPSMCSKDYLPKPGKKLLEPGVDVAGEKTFSPLPYNPDKLKSMGLVTGNRANTNNPVQTNDDPAREKEWQAWLAAKNNLNRPQKVSLPVIR